MRVYYDTEFLEDGSTIELISIGMVAEDGRELYAVNEEIQDDPLWSRIRRERWLMANVVPHLPLRERDPMPKPPQGSNGTQSFYLDQANNVVMPRRLIRNLVRDFLAATPAVELWADYGAYDHVVLAQLFGRMINLPGGVPMWTNDLRQELARLGNPPLPVQPEGLHNALADARHLKARAEHLRASAEERSDEAPNASDLPEVRDAQ